MKSKNKKKSPNLFQSRLDQIINPKHELVKLAKAIDWSVFEEELGQFYSEDKGRPAKPIRLMAGLHYLKYTFNESDESVVEGFLENPYWQYFCGFEYFQHDFPLDPTSLVKWRGRIGPDKIKLLLKETVDVALRCKLLKKTDCKRVNADTTVQEKAIAFPTDAKLCHTLRLKLVQAASSHGIKLRQSYQRLSREALIKQSRYRQANQHKRASKMVKKIKTYLGCVVRDIRRKAAELDSELSRLLSQADRLLAQERDSKNKLYSLHAPEVECISKGKSYKRYEFGCKVGVVSTSRGNWIVGIKSFHGNPYDGHTLQSCIETSEEISGVSPKHIHVDKGYRKHDYEGDAQVHVSGCGPRKKSRWDRLWRRRRSAIEPVIGHAKHDNRMNRNYLKGEDGDEINAVLAAAGFNMRKLLKAFFLPGFLRVQRSFIRWIRLTKRQMTVVVPIESIAVTL